MTHIAQSSDLKVENKQNKVMYMSTTVFKFLDICSYVSPGTSYEKWVKTYGAKLSNSWLPYEWFDCADKLDFEGLPPYRYCFPKQENKISLVAGGV